MSASRIDTLTLSFLRRHFGATPFSAVEARRRVKFRIDLIGRLHAPAYGLPSTAGSWRVRLRTLESRGYLYRVGRKWALREVGEADDLGRGPGADQGAVHA